MAERTIAHALFNWIDSDGMPRMAHHRETVDLPDDVIETYAPLGVFEDLPAAELVEQAVATTPNTAEAPDDSVIVAPTEPEPLVVPEWVSPKAVWADYAAQLGIDTTDLTKEQLIAAVNELALAQKQETEHA